MVFPNLYYKRTAATTKACYICYKPTVIVLATIDVADFFYACPTHLADRGFATRVPDPDPEPKKPSVSPEDIAKVKQEWEEKQREKKAKGQKKEDNKVDDDGKNGTDGARKDAEGKESDPGTKGDSKEEKKSTAAQSPLPPAELVARPAHERYILHRDIFALRTADHRRRRQAAQTKDLAPRLPGAPRGSLQ